MIRAICIASAEYCAELKIRALKAGNGASAEVLSEVERQFRALASSIAVESPRADLYAIHRGIVDTLPCTEATRIVTVEPTAERSPQQVSVGRDEGDEKERAIGSEQPTLSPVEGREQRLQRFITAHSGATLANIKYSAVVFTSDFQKWRKGELKPDSVMSGRIEDVLTGRQPLLKKLRKQRTD